MTMTLDTNQHRYFDHMSSYQSHPHFTNPWASSSSTTGHSAGQNVYMAGQDSTVLPHLNLSSLPKHAHSHPQQGQGSRTNSSASMASYGLPVTAASAGSPPMAADVYRQHQDLHSIPQDLLSLSRLQHPTTSAGYDTSAYTTAASPVNPTYAPSPTHYDQLGYAPAPLRQTFAMAAEDNTRRYSQQSVASNYLGLGAPQAADDGAPPPSILLSDFDRRGLQPDDRRSFQDAIEASHGMLSMSQDTPRNIYDVRGRGRGSQDSYGFPAHSASSSVSSASYGAYYGGSIDGSVSDYSTAGSDIESLSGRTLPRPQGLMSSHPPAPQSMMGSFSSKVSSSTQKKHKCKVCDKRFTRPSSLQTHMYSHTGEKRTSFFSSPFSVVSLWEGSQLY